MFSLEIMFADNLEKSNIFIRKLNNYKLSDCLRISIGSEKDLKKLLRQVKKITTGTNKWYCMTILAPPTQWELIYL